MSRSFSVAGLDLSLSGAGLAVIQSDFAVNSEDERLITKTFSSEGHNDDPLATRIERLVGMADDIADEIAGLMEWPELVALEDMPYGAQGAGTVARTGLWWLVVERLHYRLGIPTMLVNVSTVKIYATGKGNKVGKDEVMLAVARRYPDAPITNNNEADAFTLAAIAARAKGAPIEESLPQTHLRAMDKVVLP
ncbi:RuvC-like resolvase [Microbacterium phage SadLad]|nr:RuvC-like resolvase [Microbacterium phage SadLad]